MEKSQIGRGFEQLTNSLEKSLNPPIDASREAERKSLNAASETLSKFYSKVLNVCIPVECSDREMINLIQMTLVAQGGMVIESVEDAIDVINVDLSGIRGQIERIEENLWMIKTEDACKVLAGFLRDRYRELRS